MDKPTHTDSPLRTVRPKMLSKSKILKALRDQRQILANSPASVLAQGGILELDRAINAIEGME